MGSNGNISDLIRVSYLDLQAFAKWREQLSEDDLLIPDWFITALLDWGFPLKTQKNNTELTELENTSFQSSAYKLMLILPFVLFINHDLNICLPWLIKKLVPTTVLCLIETNQSVLLTVNIFSPCNKLWPKCTCKKCPSLLYILGPISYKLHMFWVKFEALCSTKEATVEILL